MPSRQACTVRWVARPADGHDGYPVQHAGVPRASAGNSNCGRGQLWPERDEHAQHDLGAHHDQQHRLDAWSALERARGLVAVTDARARTLPREHEE